MGVADDGVMLLIAAVQARTVEARQQREQKTLSAEHPLRIRVLKFWAPQLERIISSSKFRHFKSEERGGSQQHIGVLKARSHGQLLSNPFGA